MKLTLTKEYSDGDGITCRVTVDPLPDEGLRLTIKQPGYALIINLNSEQAFALADLLIPKEARAP